MIKPVTARATARLALNAAVLVFASLAVMSWLSGRWALGLLWSGSLLVAFAELLTGRSDTTDSTVAGRRLLLMRAAGLAGAVMGAVVTITSRE